MRALYPNQPNALSMADYLKEEAKIYDNLGAETQRQLKDYGAYHAGEPSPGPSRRRSTRAPATDAFHALLDWLGGGQTQPPADTAAAQPTEQWDVDAQRPPGAREVSDGRTVRRTSSRRAKAGGRCASATAHPRGYRRPPSRSTGRRSRRRARPNATPKYMAQAKAENRPDHHCRQDLQRHRRAPEHSLRPPDGVDRPQSGRQRAQRQSDCADGQRRRAPGVEPGDADRHRRHRAEPIRRSRRPRPDRNQCRQARRGQGLPRAQPSPRLPDHPQSGAEPHRHA